MVGSDGTKKNTRCQRYTGVLLGNNQFHKKKAAVLTAFILLRLTARYTLEISPIEMPFYQVFFP